jgi:dihydroxyacetone kinase-like predicted kinase
MLAIATRDFRANKLDIKKGDIFEIEDKSVIVNKQFFCKIGSPNFQVYFELIE